MQRQTGITPLKDKVLDGQGFRMPARGAEREGVMFMPEKGKGCLTGYLKNGNGAYQYQEASLTPLPRNGTTARVVVYDPKAQGNALSIQTVYLKTISNPALARAEEKKRAVAGEKTHLNYVASAVYTGGGVQNFAAHIDMLTSIEKPNAGIHCGMRLTAISGVLTGTIGIIRNKESYKRAKEIGDRAGQIVSSMNGVRGVTEIGASVSLFSGRTIGLAQAAAASKVGAVAGEVFAIGATAFGVVFFLLMGIPAVAHGIQSFSFRQALKKEEAKGDLQALQFLMKLLMFTPEEYTKAANESIQFTGPLALYKMVKDPIILTKEEQAKLTPEDRKAIRKAVRRKVNSLDGNVYEAITDWNQVGKNLYYRMAKKVVQMREVKENSYQTKAGGSSVKRINAKMGGDSLKFINEELAKPIGDRLVTKLGNRTATPAEQAQAKEIIVAAKKEARNRMIWRAIIITACVLGIIAFIVGTVYTGGAPLIIAAVFLLVMNMLATAIDFNDFLTEIKSVTTANKRDKMLTTMFLVIVIAAAVVGVVFSGGMLPMMVIGGVTTVVLLVKAYAIFRFKLGFFGGNNRKEAEAGNLDNANRTRRRRVTHEQATLEERRALMAQRDAVN